MSKKRAKRKPKGLLDELTDLIVWWSKSRKKAAARGKKRAEAKRARVDAAKDRDEKREIRAAERARYAAEVKAKRVERRLAQTERRRARIAAAGPVVTTVKGTVWPTETVGGHGGTAQGQPGQPGAVQCGAPTLDGTACQNLVTDGKCSAGHQQRKRNRVTGTPLTPADARFYARRDEGYSGPLDRDGYPVTRVTEGKYRR